MEVRVWCHLHLFGLLEAAPANEGGNIFHHYEVYRASPFLIGFSTSTIHGPIMLVFKIIRMDFILLSTQGAGHVITLVVN
jgi:hypothetical protein